jgi:hypothetical protein
VGGPPGSAASARGFLGYLAAISGEKGAARRGGWRRPPRRQAHAPVRRRWLLTDTTGRTLAPRACVGQRAGVLARVRHPTAFSCRRDPRRRLAQRGVTIVGAAALAAGTRQLPAGLESAVRLQVSSSTGGAREAVGQHTSCHWAMVSVNGQSLAGGRRREAVVPLLRVPQFAHAGCVARRGCRCQPQPISRAAHAIQTC